MTGITEDINYDLRESQILKADAFIPHRYHSSSSVSTPRSPTYVDGWLSEKSVKNVQEKSDYESSAMKDMYVNLLENERRMQQHLDDVIERDNMVKNRKLHSLLQEWYEQTYIPLNRKISEEMNSESYRELDRKRREQYDKYLKHRNKKGHIFLDTFEKEEYDPLYLNSQRPGPLKAVTQKLADPLLQQQHEKNEEDRIVLACDLGTRLSDKEIEMRRLPPLPLVPLGRHGTKCKTWLDMELTDIQSNVRQRSQERFYGAQNVSSSELDIFDKKCKWKKRRQFLEKYDSTIQLL